MVSQHQNTALTNDGFLVSYNSSSEGSDMHGASVASNVGFLAASSSQTHDVASVTSQPATTQLSLNTGMSYKCHRRLVQQFSNIYVFCKYTSAELLWYQ